jgi:G3E family GTPase
VNTPSKPLPVVLVSGFLGAGKTTLMRHLIRDTQARGWKVAVIVNEFGTADIDSHILREADAELIASIAGGCACCSGQDEFHETLLEIATRTPYDKPDLILVEASGLADPVLLLDVLTAAQLLPFLRAGALVTLVDAARLVDDRLADGINPLMRRQAQLADLLVLNKTDLALQLGGPAALEKAEARVRALHDKACLVRASEARFDFSLLWEMAGRTRSHIAPGTTDSIPHSAHTVVCPLPHPVERARLEAALQSLGAEVWRAKGFVRLRGEDGLQLLQYTGGPGGGRFRFAPFHLGPHAPEPATALVFIGPSLDREKLMHDFSGRGDWLPMI